MPLVTLALLAVLAGGAAAGREAGPPVIAPASTPPLLSDTSGTLEEIVLQYSSALGEDVLPTYRSLLSKLEPDTIVHIVCEDAEEASRFRDRLVVWDIPHLERCIVTNADRELTVWARDRFLVKARDNGSGRTIVVLPTLPLSEGTERLNDVSVPAFLAAASTDDIETREAGFFFEGGNIVTSDAFVFTSSVLLEECRDPEREFARPVVVLGSRDRPEPLVHVDMYVTPINDTLVLLGDPDLGEALLARENPPEGDPEEEWWLRAADDDLADPGVRREWRRAWDFVARQLAERRLVVRRIPLLMDEEGNVVTYNNVIMEVRDGRRIVYMPTYDVPVLDAAAERTYRSLGCEVRDVDVSRIYSFGGALRCLTNVLRRGEEPAGAPCAAQEQAR